MKGIAVVDAGICGFSVYIEAEADDAFDICGVTVRTECPNIKEVGDTFEIDILDTMKHGYRSKFFSMIQQKTPPLHKRLCIGYRDLSCHDGGGRNRIAERHNNTIEKRVNCRETAWESLNR